MAEGGADDLLKLTAMIVSAHVSKNHVAPDAVASLIHDVHKTLSQAGAPAEQQRDLVPAVPVKKSVYPDYIICLEDGRKLKMLKRHLQTTYNMTPNEYRTKWGLPSDYPMVAPSYAERRSSLAKEIGLGKRPGEGKAAPLKRGRPKKVA